MKLTRPDEQKNDTNQCSSLNRDDESINEFLISDTSFAQLKNENGNIKQTSNLSPSLKSKNIKSFLALRLSTRMNDLDNELVLQSLLDDEPQIDRKKEEEEEEDTIFEK
jgi:hypothetical protein